MRLFVAITPPRTVLLEVRAAVDAVIRSNGIGSAAQSATQEHDLAVIQGVALVYCLVVVAANLLTDLAYGWVNPKARTW